MTCNHDLCQRRGGPCFKVKPGPWPKLDPNSAETEVPNRCITCGWPRAEHDSPFGPVAAMTCRHYKRSVRVLPIRR